ncbi:hypothetical protein SRHO_G00273710 [Serrasalmus rhombeus]
MAPTLLPARPEREPDLEMRLLLSLLTFTVMLTRNTAISVGQASATHSGGSHVAKTTTKATLEQMLWLI